MRRFAGRRGAGVEQGKETIAILGGTGDLGTGLAIRWSKAGYRIVIGSRTLEKARNAVANLARRSARRHPPTRWRIRTPQRRATSWC